MPRLVSADRGAAVCSARDRVGGAVSVLVSRRKAVMDHDSICSCCSKRRPSYSICTYLPKVCRQYMRVHAVFVLFEPSKTTRGRIRLTEQPSNRINTTLGIQLTHSIEHCLVSRPWRTLWSAQYRRRRRTMQHNSNSSACLRRPRSFFLVPSPGG